MGFSPITVWSNRIHRCVLRREGGRFELLLYLDGRVVRLETCENEPDARRKAHEWLIALEEITHH